MMPKWPKLASPARKLDTSAVLFLFYLFIYLFFFFECVYFFQKSFTVVSHYLDIAYLE